MSAVLESPQEVLEFFSQPQWEPCIYC